MPRTCNSNAATTGTRVVPIAQNLDYSRSSPISNQPLGVCAHLYGGAHSCGFRKLSPVIGLIDWSSTLSTGLRNHHRPRFPPPSRNHPNPLYLKSLHKLLSTTFKTATNPKCLSTTSTKISTTLLIIPILLTMCGITVRWLTRSPKLWPGYLHLSPRDGTTTFGPAGLTMWETGSCKLRNIGTGLVIFVGVNAMVQRCFAMEVPGLARATLGEIKYTRRNKSSANRL